MLIAGSGQIKEIDRYAIEEMGIPSTLLMEKAASAICSAALLRMDELGLNRAVVFCGDGNNGGDGFAAARMLHMRGISVIAVFTGRADRLTADCAEMVSRLEKVGVKPTSFTDIEGELQGALSGTLVIDAMYGIGFRGSLKGESLRAAKLINASSAYVIAADIPSGVEADSGNADPSAVCAGETVTFTLPKLGHLFPPGAQLSGRVTVHDIGIPEQAVLSQGIKTETTSREMCDRLLPVRKRWSHKGDYGKVFMLCGSVGFTGAAVFASRGAVAAGAGLVSLGVPESVYGIAASRSDEVMVFPCPDKDGKFEGLSPEFRQRVLGADAILMGPGMGRSDKVTGVLADVLRNARCPVVLDADGINAAAENINILCERAVPLIITPHDVEFARLRGGIMPKDRVNDALAFAKKYNCVVVLKGHRSIIASPDGRVRINITGGPGMAKGGSGDLLAGIISAFAGMGLSAFDAASAGAYIHGVAGDLCAEDIGEYGMTPTDMIKYIAKVLKCYNPKQSDNFWE